MAAIKRTRHHAAASTLDSKQTTLSFHLAAPATPAASSPSPPARSSLIARNAARRAAAADAAVAAADAAIADLDSSQSSSQSSDAAATTAAASNTLSVLFCSSLAMTSRIAAIKQSVAKGHHGQTFPADRADAYDCDILVLAPHRIGEQKQHTSNPAHGYPPCSECGSSSEDHIKSRGWLRPLYVYGLHRCSVLLVQRYTCSNTACKAKPHFAPSSEKAYAKLPTQLVEMLPCRMIGKFWYDVQVIRYIVEHRIKLSLAQLRENMRRSVVAELEDRQTRCPGFNVQSPFSTEYGEEQPPSEATIQEVYLASVDMLYGSQMNSYFDSLTSDVYMADHNFSSLRQVRVKAVNGKMTKPFDALYTIMCGNTHRVVAWRLVISTEHEQSRELWQVLRQRHYSTMSPPPAIVAVDNCCQDRSLIHSVFPDCRVALDTYHIMDRIHRTLNGGGNHPHRASFMHDWSATAYGETSLTAAQMKARSKQRKLLPQQELLAALDVLMAQYKTLPPPRDQPDAGQLFTSKAWPCWLRQREHIAKGCLNAGDTDIRSQNTTSPLEALHSKIASFGGGTVQAADTYFRHVFWEFNRRRDVEHGLATPAATPATRVAATRLPRRNLESMGVLRPYSTVVVADMLHQSFEHAIDFITDSQLTSSSHVDGLQRLISQLNVASSYRSILMGTSSRTWLELNGVSIKQTVDEWSVDELALLKYMYAHPHFEPLFAISDWPALEALWYDTVDKASLKGTRNPTYTFKTASSIHATYLQLRAQQQVSQHLAQPTVKYEISEEQYASIHAKLVEFVNGRHANYTATELLLLRTLVNHSTGDWDTIMKRWHARVDDDIKRGFVTSSTTLEKVAVFPRQLGPLKQKWSVMQGKAKLAGENLTRATTHGLIDRLNTLAAAQLQQPPTEAPPAAAGRKPPRPRMTKPVQAEFVAQCRNNMQTGTDRLLATTIVDVLSGLPMFAKFRPNKQWVSTCYNEYKDTDYSQYKTSFDASSSLS